MTQLFPRVSGRMLVFSLLICTLWLLDMPAYSQSAPWYNVTWLRTPSGPGRSQAYGINDRGEVIGYSWVGTLNIATLWSPSLNEDMTPISLGGLGGTVSRGLAINASGEVAGVSNLPGNAGSHAVLWHADAAGRATPIDLGTAGGASSQAYGMNDDGRVVGWSHVTGNTAVDAMLWSPTSGGAMTSLDLGKLDGISCVAYGMNERGQVAGYYSTRDFVVHALLWNPTADGTMVPTVLNTLGSHAWAFAVNERGEVAGQAYRPGGSLSHAVRWTPAVGGTRTITDLGTLGGIYSGGFGIDDSGQMVGTASTVDEARRAVLWIGSQIVDLNARVIGGTDGWTLREAWGINASGQIAGWGIGPDSQPHAFLLTPGEPNRAPVANAGADRTVEADTIGGANVTLDGSGSTDQDGDALSYTWDTDNDGAFDDETGATPVADLPLGTHQITLRVTDAGGLASTDAVTIQVVDTTSPHVALTVLQPDLWSPNHRLVLIAKLSDLTDTCDAKPTLEVKVSSNEPIDGPGSGHSDPDWKIVEQDGGVWEIWVRSERSGNGSGREYYLNTVATDAAGNRSDKTATLSVAHDRRSSKPTTTAIAASVAATAGGGSQITVNVSSSAFVGVTILNLAGKVMAVLPEQQLQQGVSTLLWNGRITSGTKAPAGRYLVRVTARSEGGGQSQAIVPVSLSR